jgi:hypothetical protein
VVKTILQDLSGKQLEMLGIQAPEIPRDQSTSFIIK